MLFPTSFYWLLLVQEFWVEKGTLVKGFVQQGVSNVKCSLIMTRLFPLFRPLLVESSIIVFYVIFLMRYAVIIIYFGKFFFAN